MRVLFLNNIGGGFKDDVVTEPVVLDQVALGSSRSSSTYRRWIHWARPHLLLRATPRCRLALTTRSAGR